MTQGVFSNAFDNAVTGQIVKMIEDGDPANLTKVLDIHLNTELIPDWHKNEMISRIYFLLREKQKQAKTRRSRENLHAAVRIMENRYGCSPAGK